MLAYPDDLQTGLSMKDVGRGGAGGGRTCSWALWITEQTSALKLA